MDVKQVLNTMLVSTLYAGILGAAAGIVIGVTVLWLVNYVMDKRERNNSQD